MRILRRLCRVTSLVILSVVATSALMYCAPGYFSDVREMDAAHGVSARADLIDMRRQQGSIVRVLWTEVEGWAHGDLGQSRQFGTPVSELLRERLSRSAALLFGGVAGGWSAALLLALPFSLQRGAGTRLLLATATASLLAVPVGAMATLFFVANWERPALVLAIVVAVRDFRLAHQILEATWRAPYVVHARAQGLSTMHIFRAHTLPAVGRELLAIGLMSFTLALSALVPVEVIFDVPGLGQLAWNAAMNRDLPVLVAVTAVIAACVGTAGLVLGPGRAAEEVQCA